MLRRPIERNPLKPFIFPKGFTLIQDTREQLPLFVEGDIPQGLQIERRALKNGDYSVLGYEDLFFCERKGSSDIRSYIGVDRSNTQSKLERIKDYQFKCLLIEESEYDLIRTPSYFSKLSPEAIRQTLVSFELKHNIHIYYFRDRCDARRWLLDRMIRFYNYKLKGEI